MTAPPKLDPETGEMLFFGYSPFPPYLTYHVAAADGALVRSEVIDVAWPSMMHDFAITKDHVIFILCPLVFSFERLAERGGAFSWEPERGTRLGIMPRRGGGHRFGYMAAREPELNDGAQPLWTAVRKYDLERGGVTERRFGAGNGVGEPLFVPRTASAGEDDGWVLVLVYDAARDTSDF